MTLDLSDMQDKNDPVHYKWKITDAEFIQEWWFWDETWSYEHGPYETKEKAQQALDIYVETI